MKNTTNFLKKSIQSKQQLQMTSKILAQETVKYRFKNLATRNQKQ